MSKITLELKYPEQFVCEDELFFFRENIKSVHHILHEQKGPGKEETRWIGWPSEFLNSKGHKDLKEIAKRVKENADVFLVIGVGGSYLSSRAGFNFLCSSFHNQLPREERNGPQVFFAGSSLSSDYIKELYELLKDKNLYINVVSKSGTTLEPNIVFDIFKDHLEKKYGKKEAKNRIIVTTSSQKGPLYKLALKEGYDTLVIPEGMPGRYTVHTPVALFPFEIMGIDTEKVLEGAKDAETIYSEKDIEENPCYRYAALRNIFYKKGKTIELLASYDPSLELLGEWWKQLYGESEGKQKKGIFPVGASYTRDLHSLGQYVQEGRRDFFSTTIWVNRPDNRLNTLKGDKNYSGWEISDLNEIACEGTIKAHSMGDVPNIKIDVPEKSPYYFGMLTYFFMKACAMSAYLLGVNPFVQPGVEKYKQNIRESLGTGSPASSSSNSNDDQKESMFD
ncbi:glucose-6-phosphate isomerase [Natranaerofaba carboxydovora]|uniref:glucose-6-phosphate isomerase n=1 Tax=Natranaerofaba carboxydovora TaxID=2742683 RepID=UPI001F12A7B5|nr:glucose-6-phosphate isomerase [Natranaerofaba carboxydovora]UMZ74740.1 Glucose-6-phosphate isomerase [Natranaerofaba carboxydovora]